MQENVFLNNFIKMVNFFLIFFHSARVIDS